jgi:NADH dehydrogenase
LVLAPGSESNFFGVEGADRHAFPLRWMDDAIPLRHHVLSCFEAATCASGELRRQLLTFVVVGGGPTGVEYSGALAELILGPLLRDFPAIGRDEVQVVLVEATDALLAAMPSRLRTYARDRLVRRHVSIRLGTTVEAVGPTSVRLSNGETLATETIVWTAGVKGDPRAAQWGLPVGRGGRVPVTPELSVEGRPEVYVVGDLAYLEEGRHGVLPQVAQVAIQQGRHAASNILAAVDGRQRKPFHYKDPGMLAVIGRNAAVADVFGRTFKGLPAWLLWLGIHITWLIGFRNRALVLLNWAWNYLFFQRAVRLILPTLAVPPDEGGAARRDGSAADVPREAASAGERAETGDGRRAARHRGRSPIG